MASINNYLNFKGNCREAMEFYTSVFGGNLNMQTFGESPMADKTPPGMKDLVMHATLEGGTIVLMGSDSMKPENYTIGNSVILTFNADSPEQAKEVFEKLSAGGNPTMPLAEQFWGGMFGSLDDKFGIHWFVSYQKPK